MVDWQRILGDMTEAIMYVASQNRLSFLGLRSAVLSDRTLVDGVAVTYFTGMTGALQPHDPCDTA